MPIGYTFNPLINNFDAVRNYTASTPLLIDTSDNITFTTPGSDKQFIYNNAGVLGGSSFFNYALDNIPTIGDGNAQITSIGSCTISNASPCVVTKASHGLAIGDRVTFRSSGGVPAPLHPSDSFDGVREFYYIIAAGFTSGSFQISLTRGGAAINTTTAGSGTQTLFKYVNYQLNFDADKDCLVEWRKDPALSGNWTLSVRRSDDTYFQYPGYAARFAVNCTQVIDYESPVAFSAFINAGANTSELYGFWGGVYDFGSSAFNISGQAIGILCYNYLGGSNARTLANIIGGDFTSEMGSNITGTNVIGGRFQAIVAATSATFTNAYGVRILSSVGTLTNNFGLHVAQMTGGTANHSVFLAAAAQVSFRAGTQAIWSPSASVLRLTANTTFDFYIGADPSTAAAGTSLANLTSNAGWTQSFSAAYGVAATWKCATFSATNTTATGSGAGTGISINLTTAQTNGTHNLLIMNHSSTGQTSGQIRGGFFSIGSSASETPGVVGYSIGLGRGTTGAAQAGANNQLDGFIMHMASSTNGGTGFGIRMERGATYPAAMVAFQSFGDITTLDDNQWDIGKTGLRFKTLFLDTSLDMLDADIVTDTSVGMKLCTATNQKWAAWNATPVIQPVNTDAIDTFLTTIGLRASGGVANFDTDIKAAVVGKGLYVKEGTNATMGVATLVAGTVVVSTTKVTANSRIFLTEQTNGGTLGSVSISARTPGTSFTISSTNVLDTSSVAWFIVEPA